MKVHLIAHTPTPEQLVAAAAKTCYSATDIDGIFNDLTEQKTESFLTMLTDIGHESPVEHASFTFAIEGVSRSLLAQITRHRIASFSVQSQRYVKENSFAYVIPHEIEAIPEAKELFIKAMNEDQATYERLTCILFDKHYQKMIACGIDEKAAKSKAQKQAIEDARYVLPNACETKLIMTANARSLDHFFKLRCCNRAQWEIRELAEEMYRLVLEVAPTLFSKSGPSCVSGPCTEGKMSCGKMEEVRKKYIAMREAQTGER